MNSLIDVNRNHEEKTTQAITNYKSLGNKTLILSPKHLNPRSIIGIFVSHDVNNKKKQQLKHCLNLFCLFDVKEISYFHLGL